MSFDLSIMEASRRACIEDCLSIERLALQLNGLARMDYDFLSHKARHLLAIGYNVGEHRLDSSYYDAICWLRKRDFPVSLRLLKESCPRKAGSPWDVCSPPAGGEPVLLSWGGSMFEYLMPLLVMPTYEDTLLDRTCKAAVDGQIEYGRKPGAPWGISPLGYNAIDVHLNYQYRSFGVPGMGSNARRLAEDLVIAPYASALALRSRPRRHV